MNKTNSYIALLVVITLVTVFLILTVEQNRNEVVSSIETTQTTNQESIRQLIEESIDKVNFCKKNSDCKIVSFGCPFGCYSLINKSVNTSEIEASIDEYNKNEDICVYKCASQPSVDEISCINNKCVFSKN